MRTEGLGVRWTIGDVSSRGFEALRLSIHGAVGAFGDAARYAVCVNSIGIERAQLCTGAVPGNVEWIDVSTALSPVVAHYLDARMSGGTGWKFAPLRLFPERHELALDNDVILWHVPRAVREWMAQDELCVVARDVQRCLGRFDADCPSGSFNSGIRGVPPGFPYESAIKALLNKKAARDKGLLLASELDEQGLQIAASVMNGALLTVELSEVTICSPFWPKSPEVGTCGAHFVGLNARHLPWDYFDRPADEWQAEHWQRHREDLYRRVGLTAPDLES